MSVFKKIPPKKPFSFVEAVTREGDCWRCLAPLSLGVGENWTHDKREAYAMAQMERGVWARVEL